MKANYTDLDNYAKSRLEPLTIVIDGVANTYFRNLCSVPFDDFNEVASEFYSDACRFPCMEVNLLISSMLVATYRIASYPPSFLKERHARAVLAKGFFFQLLECKLINRKVCEYLTQETLSVPFADILTRLDTIKPVD